MAVNSVLLLRINAYGELYQTRGIIPLLRSKFPAARVVALTTPQSEGRALLAADTRLDDVLLFPPVGDVEKSPSAFRAFLRRQKFEAVVACLGALPGMDYSRPLLSLLLCPGRKYVLDGSQDIHPAFSRRGVAAMSKVLRSAVRERVGRRIAEGLGRAAHGLLQRVFRRPRPAESGDAGAGLNLTREKIERVLWVRVDGIGDVVMMLPALHALQSQFPQARIDLLVRPLSASLVQELPGIGQVYTYEPDDAPRTTRSGRRQSLLSLARLLRKNRYDLAVDIAGRDVARLLAWVSGAKRRVSPGRSIYDPPTLGNLAFLMTDPVPLGLDKTRPAVDNFLELMGRIGVTIPNAPYRLTARPEQTARVRETLAALGVDGHYAVIHAKSSEEMRDWRPERFAGVADHLVERHGLRVVLCGTERDRDNNRAIHEASRGGRHIVDATGAFSLPELPALLAEARLMVTVDTGPAHIAAMVGTPVVCIALPCFHYNRPYRQWDGVVKRPEEVAGLDGVFSGLVAEHFWEGRLLDYITAADVRDVVDAKLDESRDFLRRAA